MVSPSAVDEAQEDAGQPNQDGSGGENEKVLGCGVWHRVCRWEKGSVRDLTQIVTRHASEETWKGLMPHQRLAFWVAHPWKSWTKGRGADASLGYPLLETKVENALFLDFDNALLKTNSADRR